ncbi:RagB/SusD family nutrient uptake outer membrane protein [Polaribacter sp. 20A6]|uniref:RagB/SusD family nutrient uptake outer membrane protein n=1 Tax=Polaribacter sp. 20A6 TaxID=2687289 RepID=UPI0013FD62CF|nr:RagB/SusD family nutrient uptake outer membrane protein [Polaribacter sp. 20A6]
MKYIKTLVVIFSFVLLNSCSDFLEINPIGKSTTPVFFSDMDGIRGAVPGAYATVYEYYGEEFMLYPDVASDMLQVNTVGETSMTSQYNYSSNPEEEITAVGRIWTNAFEALANVNNIIKYQPSLLQEFPENEDELRIIKAEALFLRALIHFDLVRVYAQSYNFTADASHLGIPVLTDTPSSDDNVARNTVSEVYAQILKDLKDSEEIYGDEISARSSYYATKNAVHGLLAKVYLYMEEWTNAANYASLAITSTPLAEGDDYLNMFLYAIENDESLFKLNGKLKEPEIIDFYDYGTPLGYAGDKLITLLNENQDDLRLQLLNEDTSGTLKYAKTDTDINDRYYNIIVLRTSEMYLIRAEANNNLDNIDLAIEDIKTLQARNYQKNVSEITVSENTKETLAVLIEKERSKELCFEGNRLYDLTRTKQDIIRDDNSTSTVKEVLYPNSLFVLPIPQKEVDVNTSMIQNEGY